MYNNLGNALDSLGRTDEALLMANKALALEPNSFDCNINTGNLMMKVGRLQEAETCMRRALVADPKNFAVNYNLANILQALQLFPEAIECYKIAIDSNPTFPAPYNNLGNTYKKLGEVSLAIGYYQNAVELEPDNSMALGNLGGLYTDIRDFDSARSVCLEALRIDPSNVDAFHNYLFGLNYESVLSEVEIFQEHLEWNRRHGHEQQVASISNEVMCNPSQGNRGTGIKRVGFVSGDFCQHSVAYFLEPLIEGLAPSEYEIYCYSNVQREDTVTERIKRKVQEWRSILVLSNEESAELIKTDKIDILIDLAGHTSNNRLLLFALRPARVQASWLGYPNTTGLSAIDFRITDEIADPQGVSDNLHSESLVRIDTGFLCYQAGQVVNARLIPPVVENGYVTFGSFNNISKITKQVIEVWSGIFLKLPNARLILKSKTFTDKRVSTRILSEFSEYGISSNRITLLQFADGYSEHLSLYNDIDIALDTFPYNGTTTTCEALWMRVPVVSFAGNSHRSRVTNSILRRIGLDKLCGDSLEEYVDCAVALADSVAELTELRSRLRETMGGSVLCNPQVFGENMVRAFDQMLETVKKP